MFPLASKAKTNIAPPSREEQEVKLVEPASWRKTSLELMAPPFIALRQFRKLISPPPWLMTPAQMAPPCVAAELFSMRTRDPSAKNSLRTA